MISYKACKKCGCIIATLRKGKLCCACCGKPIKTKKGK